MEIQGWKIRTDSEGNMLRTSRERPKTHYTITILNRWAIDIDVLKSEVDALPTEKKDQILIDLIINAINEAKDQGPCFAKDIQWNAN